MTNIRKRPLLWGEQDLDDTWFRKPLLEQAQRIADEQAKGRRRRKPAAPPLRRSLETDPDLDGWFD